MTTVTIERPPLTPYQNLNTAAEHDATVYHFVTRVLAGVHIPTEDLQTIKDHLHDEYTYRSLRQIMMQERRRAAYRLENMEHNLRVFTEEDSFARTAAFFRNPDHHFHAVNFVWSVLDFESQEPLKFKDTSVTYDVFQELIGARGEWYSETYGLDREETALNLCEALGLPARSEEALADWLATQRFLCP